MPTFFFFKKKEISQINNLTLHIKELQKEEQTKSRDNRRKVITKIRAEINEIKYRKTLEKIKETKSWFCEKIKRIDNTLAGLTKKKKERGLK